MTDPNVDPTPRPTVRGLILAIILLAAVLALVLARRQPPAPRSADAPAAEVSGSRAREVLRDLLGDGSPHPTGSAANARVRDRIVDRLRALGYSPQIQQGFACNDDSGDCARVENVIARLEGTRNGGTVLLMAHYDSVPAGPGASDDMSGVAAALEVARALKAGPPPRNAVTFLLEDGEEAGFLGARLFRDSPLSAGVRAVVNLEARGTSGPSLMFEAIGDDADAVSRFTALAPHPVTSSVFVTIYELLPNDTDLSLFRGRGVPGLNFAFVGRPTYYHTSLDDFASTSPASLQHHADNAMAAVRGLARADLARPATGDAVFFDLFGLRVIAWPEAWEPAIAILALLLVAAAVGLALRRDLRGGRLGLGLLAFLGALVLSAVAAFVMSLAVQKVTWVAHPLPLVAAFWLMPLAIVGLVAAAGLGRRAGFSALWAGVWLAWSLLGLVLVFSGLPKVSYLFAIPALVAGLAGLTGLGATSALLPALVAGALWFPIVVPLYDGLGSGGLLPIAVLMTLLLSSIGPFFSVAPGRLSKGLAAAAAGLALALLGWAAVSRPFSRDSPQPITFRLYQEGEGGPARWMVESPYPLPPEILRAAPFGQRLEKAYLWAPDWWRVRKAPATVGSLPTPRLAVLEDVPVDGKRRLRLRVTSPRGASRAEVLIPAAARVETMRIGGYTLTSRNTPEDLGWYRVGLLTLPPEGMELEIVLAASTPLDWYVLDSTPGLPPIGAALRKARGPEAVSIHDGDSTQVSRKFRI